MTIGAVRLALAALLLPIALGTPGETFTMQHREIDSVRIAEAATGKDVLASLAGATDWINSRPRTAAELRGKVVLIDFWTYSCINWLRSLPYVVAWSQRYERDGLVVIGVHSPEFGFEHEIGNVRQAARRLVVTYPVAIDNDFTIWRGFDNEYWPAIYLVDARGRVRYQHFGEGDEDRTERAIRNLLAEAGSRNLGPDRAIVHAAGIEAPADWDELRSPETYLGYARGENFSSPSSVQHDRSARYSLPPELSLNYWALDGTWIVQSQAVVVHGDEGRIVYRFHARDLHLVLGPPPDGRPARFRVLLDGRPPGDAHGADVDDAGYGSVAVPRLYQLIRQKPPIADRRFEIEFFTPGAAAYSFTFG